MIARTNVTRLLTTGLFDKRNRFVCTSTFEGQTTRHETFVMPLKPNSQFVYDLVILNGKLKFCSDEKFSIDNGYRHYVQNR